MKSGQSKTAVVFIGLPGANHVQLAIHRPVGFTSHQEDDWILSMVNDLAILQAREKDPNQVENRARSIKAWKSDLAAAYPKIFAFENEVLGVRVPSKVVPWSDVSAFFRAPEKGDEKKEQPTAEEITLFKVAHATMQEHSKKHPHKYATRYHTAGGVAATVPQIALPWLRGTREAEIPAKIVEYLCHGGVADELGATIIRADGKG
jgi:hypothetical protein